MNNRISTLLFILFFSTLFCSAQNNSGEQLSAQMVVDLMKKHVSCPWTEKTVDTFKAGNPQDRVAGIAVCMFADMKVLRQAVAQHCNFILTHEPIFYNHSDETNFLENDPVFKEKMKFIRDNNLIVFRFHDHIHMTKPDGIYEGMVDKLGWRENMADESRIFYKFEKQDLKRFVQKLSATFGTNDFRVIGDPDMNFTKVALAVGAPGSRNHLKALQSEKTEVLIAGEAPEWETYQYVSDAVAQGRNKAVIFIGHIHSEEAGMLHCANWLKSFVSSVPVVFIENGQSWWSLK